MYSPALRLFVGAGLALGTSFVASAQNAQDISRAERPPARRIEVREVPLDSAWDLLAEDNFVAISSGEHPYLIVQDARDLALVRLDDRHFRFFGINKNGYALYSSLEKGIPQENLLVSKRHDLLADPTLVRSDGIVRASWRPRDGNLIALLLRHGNELRAATADLSGTNWHDLPGRSLSGSLLRWTLDGKFLLYCEVLGGPHEPQSIRLHKYDVDANSDLIISLAGPQLNLDAAETAAIEALFEVSPDIAQPTQSLPLSRAKESSVSVRLAADGVLVTTLQTLGSDLSLEGYRPIRIFKHAVIVQLVQGGVSEFKAVDRSSLATTPVFSASTQLRLPWQSPAQRSVTQAGSGYGASVSSCVSDHTGKLAYAYDFGISNTDHVLSVAAGSVVAVVNNVTCNSLDNGSDGTVCADYQANCANNNGGWGNAVILMHSDGTYTKYTHLKYNSARVSNGQPVNQGTYLGDPGHTGNTVGQTNGCGDHLHFQQQDVGNGGMNDQSIWVNFGESGSPLACHAFYISQNTETTGLYSVGGGSPSPQISTVFQTAYNVDGSSVLGNPTGPVTAYSDTFYSPAISGYYQNFVDSIGRNMSLQLISPYQQAFSVKWGFSDLYSRIGSYKSHKVYDLVVAPTANQSPAGSTSVSGSQYTWQPFLKGSMYYFDSGGFSAKGWLNQSEYVWGEISDRYGLEGGRGGQMGLPLSEATLNPTTDGWEWWYQWFERGFIWRAQRTSGGTVWTYAFRYTSDVTNSNGQWINSALGWVQH